MTRWGAGDGAPSPLAEGGRIGFGRPGRATAPGGQHQVETSDAIIEAVAASRRRDRIRFRALFIGTWAVLFAIIIGGLLSAGKIDAEFIGRWQEFILGGVPVTILVSATSIAIAIVFAALGALGRLSSQPVI